MVVADEMQNASAEQLKLLQNRQGSFTKLVIIGDPKQKKTRSGKTSEKKRSTLPLLHAIV